MKIDAYFEPRYAGIEVSLQRTYPMESRRQGAMLWFAVGSWFKDSLHFCT